MLINIHHFILNKNVRIASEWFQIGSIAVWRDSQETKQRKLYEQYEQQSIEYANAIAYENGMVLS
jgi:hypothetical protein